MTLADLESQIEFHFSKSVQPEKSIWVQLVDSSRCLHGNGCDGILLGKIVEHGLKILEKVSDREILNIWKKTKNAMITMEDGDTDLIREQMLMDIEVELYESLCDTVCAQARKRKKI